MRKKKIFCITTCRSRVALRDFDIFSLSEYAYLHLDRVEADLVRAQGVNDIDGYIIEICSLKYQNSKLSKKEFLERIKHLKSLILPSRPILWITHVNVKLTEAHCRMALQAYRKQHSKDCELHDFLSQSGFLLSRDNIDCWLKEALSKDPYSVLFYPGDFLQGYNSESAFKPRKNKAEVDLQHYSREAGVKCKSKIVDLAKDIFYNNDL